ncbi:MAG: hypothetical protein WDO15_02485 [Bacteroidota bacterium]
MLSNTGAKNEALGSSTSVSVDEWSLWRNPAGLASVESPVISSGIRKMQNIPAFTRSVVLAIPTRLTSLGAGMSAFGDDIYNEQAASLAVANTIGLVSLGVRADVIQLRIDGSGIKRAIGITIGSIAKITPQWSIGACARNINLPQWASGQPLPVVLNAGLLFSPSDNFLLITEVEKNTDFDPTLKGAMEYSFRKKFFVRTGFNLFPNAAFGGIGLRTWRLAFDYALRFGYLPGYSQQLSVGVNTGKLKQRK